MFQNMSDPGPLGRPLHAAPYGAQILETHNSAVFSPIDTKSYILIYSGNVFQNLSPRAPGFGPACGPLGSANFGNPLLCLLWFD